MPVAATFSFVDEEGRSLADVARLDTMVTVIDGEKFLEDFASIESLQDRAVALGEEDERTIADLLIDQVEFANVLVINKTDRMEGGEVARLREILRHLNPEARLLESAFGRVAAAEILDTGLFDEEKAAEAPGWIKELRGEHTPETEEYGISSFVYRARRPFHPERFRRVLDEGCEGVLRAKGFVWLATKHDIIGAFSQAGNCVTTEPERYWFAAMPESEWPGDEESRAAIAGLWAEPFGDRMQEIVFIGAGMDRAGIERSLDECLLTDVEMALGEEGWAKFPDPFGEWAEGDEDAAAA
jgi:G3E family GTPase